MTAPNQPDPASSATPAKPAKRSYVSNTVIYGIGDVARQLVGFVMLPVYTRYLLPEDYGVVQLLIASIYFIETLFAFQLSHALIRYFGLADSEIEKQTLVSTIVISSTIACAISAIAIAGLSSDISLVLFNSDNFQLHVALFAPILICQVVENYAMTLLRLQRKAKLYLVLALAKLALQLVLNLVFVVVYELHALGVILSSLVSSTVYIFISFILCFGYSGVRFSRDVFQTTLKYSWPLWISGLVGLYAGMGDRFFISNYVGMAEVGIYALAIRFASLVSVLGWQPFSKMWHAESFDIQKHGVADKVFPKVFAVLLALLFTLSLAISLLSDPVIRILAPESYWGAIELVPILVNVQIFIALTGFCNFPFHVAEKTRLMSYITVCTAITATVFLLTLTPELGAKGAGISRVLATGAHLLAAYYIAKQFADYRLPVFRVYLLVLVNGAATAVAAQVEFNPLVEIVLWSSLMPVYVLVLWYSGLIDKSTREELIDRLKTTMNATMSKILTSGT